MRRSKLYLAVAVAGLVCAGRSGAARAQASPRGAGPPPGAGPAASSMLRDDDGYWPRRGWYVGGDVSVQLIGSSAWEALGCQSCASDSMAGPTMSLDVGYRLRKRVGVVGVFQAASYSGSPNDGGAFDYSALSAVVLGGGVQRWLKPRTSLRAIVGTAVLQGDGRFGSTSVNRREARGFAGQVTLDYELWGRPGLALGVSLDAAVLVTGETVVPLLGVGMSIRYSQVGAAPGGQE